MSQETMAKCKFCGADYPAARAEIGKDYCMAPKCVERGNTVRFVEVGYGKSGVDLRPVDAFSPEELKDTGNRGR